jgi:sulfur-oxidizing protein SoxY
LAALLASRGLWPLAAQAQEKAQTAAYNPAAFAAKTRADVLHALDAASPVESPQVHLSGPDIAENGAAVPFDCSTSLPGVRRMLLLVEKNPFTLSAVFDVSEAVEPAFSIRLRMDQTSSVFAVALLADGRALYAVKNVRVIVGGCDV